MFLTVLRFGSRMIFSISFVCQAGDLCGQASSFVLSRGSSAIVDRGL
jgi:hypothetical protein